MSTLYAQKDSNIRKTWFLITVFLVLIIAVGWALSQYFGAPGILYAAVGISLVMNVIAYWFSDKIALSMSGARLVKREENPYLYRIVENLAITAGLPLPRIYIIDSPQINAFATGRNPKNAAIAVTTGSLEKLENEELEGVLAHELSHVGNRDILISTVVVVLAGVISMVADWFLHITMWGGGDSDDNNHAGLLKLALVIVVIVLAPLAATLIRLAVSRKREYLADASGALLTRYPDGLARALEKIAQDGSAMPHAHNATAHLFIASPFKADTPRSPQRNKGRGNWLVGLFMTHPPLEERIKILRNLKV